MGRTVGDSYEHLKESVDAFSYQILVIKTYACLPEIKEGAVPWEDGGNRTLLLKNDLAYVFPVIFLRCSQRQGRKM